MNTGKDILPETKILLLKEAQQTFTFPNIKTRPIPSLLRDFSAPVKMLFPYSDEELTFLLAHDSDDFNRCEAGQKFMEKLLWQLVSDFKRNAH